MRTIAKLLTVGLLGLVFLIGCGGGGGGASSSDRGGGKPLTIEEAFPILNGGVKSGERRNTYSRVSKAEADSFKNGLTVREFTLDGNFYRKYNIRYSTLGTYNATVRVSEVSGEYMIILWLENDNGDVDVGDVERGAFDTIFGAVNGNLFSSQAVRVFPGDISSRFNAHAKQLKAKPYNFACELDGEDIYCLACALNLEL